jgi:DNA-directed RNA polymerase specialized sigma24 family protein
MAEKYSEETLRLLEEHHWQETIERLVVYSTFKMRRRIWRSILNGNPPDGIEADDIVNEVIEKTFSGTRNWNPMKHPNLYLWLQSQVDSEISNLLNSNNNRKQISEATIFSSTIFDGVDNITPEIEVLAQEDENESTDFLFGLLDYVKDDPQLYKIVEAFISDEEGVTKRADLARIVGISVAELDACKKRLARRIDAYRSVKALAQ